MTSITELMSVHLSSSIEDENETDFLRGLLIVRHVCAEPEVTSHPFASYRAWFEHHFAFEASR